MLLLVISHDYNSSNKIAITVAKVYMMITLAAIITRNKNRNDQNDNDDGNTNNNINNSSNSNDNNKMIMTETISIKTVWITVLMIIK